MELLSPKEKQQNLFDQAIAKLNERLYRHSTDVLENTQNLAKFKDSLCVVAPPLPQRETKLYKVEEVKHVRIGRKHWYSLKKEEIVNYTYAVTQQDEFVIGEWNNIKDAYDQANALNQIMLDAQTPEPKGT